MTSLQLITAAKQEELQSEALKNLYRACLDKQIAQLFNNCLSYCYPNKAYLIRHWN